MLFALITAILHVQAAEPSEICGQVSIQSDEPIELTVTEKELICDTLGPEPWSDVPNQQKKFFLRNFLKSRGFYFPQFNVNDGVLNVQAGQPSLIDTIKLDPNPIG